MKKLSVNDPCPCGSGKIYKRCCLKTEATRVVNDRSEAAPIAIEWLFTHYGTAVQEALNDGFFGGLDDNDYALLQEQPSDAFEGIMLNAMEWLLADGVMMLNDEEHRVIDLLMTPNGPPFSSEQKRWLKLLSSTPLRLYEIIAVKPGESMTLQDVLLVDKPAVKVMEQSGSQQATAGDLIAVRVLPVDQDFELSGAVYGFPRHRSWDLLEDLRDDVADMDPDSTLAKEITSILIPDHWLELFVSPYEMPQLLDGQSNEPLLFITDHYKVENWDAFARVLNTIDGIEGNREQGWHLTVNNAEGLSSLQLSIINSKRPNRIKVFYRNQANADDSRPWLEALCDQVLVFISREITDPKGILAQAQPNVDKTTEAVITEALPDEVMTALIEKHIHQLYTDWADTPLAILKQQSPREAIQTPEGLQQVIFILHTYEHGEAQQAQSQQRTPVSYDFLWQSLGLARQPDE